MKKIIALSLFIFTLLAVNLTNASTIFNSPRSIQPFQLTDNQGKPFTEKSFEGHWTMVFFGFTHCAMICPTTMAELNKFYQILEKENYTPLPTVMMISVDPDRDSVERMNDYVHSFNKAFIGATGDKQEIDKLSRQMGVMYMRVASKNKKDKNYQIDHSAFIMLIDPNGKMHALFSSPHKAAEMASFYQEVTSKQQG